MAIKEIERLADGFAEIEKHDIKVTKVKMNRKCFEKIKKLPGYEDMTANSNKKCFWGTKIFIDNELKNQVIFGENKSKIVFNKKWSKMF
jgi:hypothetical protein